MHEQGQEYRNFAFHLSCLATHNVLYSPCRIQTWLSTTGSKDRLWIVTTAAAFPQRLSMEATLRLDWSFYVNHSCVRDKCILNVLLLLQNLRLKEKKRKEGGNRIIEVQTQILLKSFGLTVNRLALSFLLLCAQLLGDLLFKAGTGQHALRALAVEGSLLRILQASTHAAQSAEIPTTFSSTSFIHWISGNLQDLTRMHLLKTDSVRGKKKLLYVALTRALAAPHCHHNNSNIQSSYLFC